MTAPDLVAALLPVIEALESLGVRYYVGGSVASPIHGVPRASIDADVIAELGAEHVAPESPEAPKVRVASPEDMLLAKLEWYRRGGESSERQWSDTTGLLRVQAGRIDLVYLADGAKALGVADLLERATRQAV